MNIRYNTSSAKLADEYGAIKAAKADLKVREDALKVAITARMADHGWSTIESDYFRVVRSELFTKRLNAKRVRALLKRNNLMVPVTHSSSIRWSVNARTAVAA